MFRWRTCCAEAAVDALASDYVPSSLIDAAFQCARSGMTLPDALALITDRPARLAGLHDRGRIAAGLRADLVRVRLRSRRCRWCARYGGPAKGWPDGRAGARRSLLCAATG